MNLMDDSRLVAVIELTSGALPSAGVLMQVRTSWSTLLIGSGPEMGNMRQQQRGATPERMLNC